MAIQYKKGLNKLHEKISGFIIPYKKETGKFPSLCIGEKIRTEVRESDQFQIALLGLDEYRGNNSSPNNTPDLIRKELYKLAYSWKNLSLIDLGNIIPGKTLNDSYYAIEMLISELNKASIGVVLIGGSNDLATGQFMASLQLKQTINFCAIDSRFDLEISSNINSNSYLNHLITNYSQNLFNYTNLGYQKYLVNTNDIELITNLYFDAYRLGEIRMDNLLAEPALRDADLLALDMSSIRNSDSPGQVEGNPNGFYAEEICQLAWYAGQSDRLQSFGIYEYYPEFDPQAITARLIAQIIWHYIDGKSHALRFNHEIENGNTREYYLDIDVIKHKVTFIHDTLLGKWWMKLPYTNEEIGKNMIIACSEADYKTAISGDIPDKLWRIYQKFS